jgi:hypothetical protein
MSAGECVSSAMIVLYVWISWINAVLKSAANLNLFVPASLPENRGDPRELTA